MCRYCCDRQKKHRKPDIVLTANLERPEPTDLTPLPLTQETCDYTLNTLGGFRCDEFEGPQLIIKKNHRQLKVKGSVRGQVEITIQKGEETPRVFGFTDDDDFELEVDLVKADKITFRYGAGSDGSIKLKAKIVKKYHC